MMLPILISVSPAPGSYFLSASAAVAAMAAAAIVTRRNRPANLTGIGFLPFDIFAPTVASPPPPGKQYRSAKRHCWAASFVIDAWELKFHAGNERAADHDRP